MEITEIKFRRFPAQGRLRALVSVTFDGVCSPYTTSKSSPGTTICSWPCPRGVRRTAAITTSCTPVGPLVRQGA